MIELISYQLFTTAFLLLLVSIYKLVKGVDND